MSEKFDLDLFRRQADDSIRNGHGWYSCNCGELMHEAADEIARMTAELAAARAEMRKLIDACKQHIRGDHNAEWGCDMVFDQAVAAAEKVA